ncbi:hypothetical protein EHS25_005800 [Saitozyma podzolica]|uniref:Uncharacterized protein n=1 Tax=Saitozyma podzolica TaxID=1890683 RepID=A0A427XVF5_9TREE|nr:hypothetical protein EHS25_005800 [Saitozyma podzolica]
MSVPPALNLPLSLSLSSPRSSTSSAVPSALPLTPSLDDPTLSAKVKGEGDSEGEGEDESGVRVEVELSDQTDLHSFPFQRTSTCSSSSSSQDDNSPITTSKIAYDPTDTLPSQFASFSFHATHATHPHPHPHSAPASAGGVSSPSGSPRRLLAKLFPSPTSGGDAFVFGTCPSAPLSATPTTELGQFEYPSPSLDRARSWGSQSSGTGHGNGNGNGAGAVAGSGSISARSSVSYSGRAVPLGESHRHASIIARPTDRHREPSAQASALDAHAPPSPPSARRSSTCSTITTLPASGRRPSILHSATTGSGSALPKSASTSPSTTHSPLPAVGTGETSPSPSSPTAGTTATLPSAAQLSTRRGSLPAAQLFGLPSDQLAQLALQRASISGTYAANIAPTSTTSHALYHRRDSLISDGGTSSGGSSRTVVPDGQGEGAGSGVPTRRSSFKAPRPVFEDWMSQGRRASLPFLPSLPTHGPLAAGRLPSSPLHGNGQGQGYGTEGVPASRCVSHPASQSQSQSPRLTLAERRARHSLDHGHAQSHGHTHSHGRSRTQAEGIVPNAGVISSSEESVDEDPSHGGVNRTSPRSKAGRRSKAGHQRHVQETESLELSLNDDGDGDGVGRSGEETTVTDEVESLPTPGDRLDVLGGPAWSGSDPWASAGASAASAAAVSAASGVTHSAGGDEFSSGLGLGPEGATPGVASISSNSIPPFDTTEASDNLGLAEDGFAITGKPTLDIGTDPNQNQNHPAAILANGLGIGLGLSRKTSLRDGRPGVAERPGLATIPSDSTERAE